MSSHQTLAQVSRGLRSFQDWFKRGIWRQFLRKQSFLFRPAQWGHGGHSVLLLHRRNIRKSGATGKTRPLLQSELGMCPHGDFFSQRLYLSLPWGWTGHFPSERRVAGLPEDPKKTSHREVHGRWPPLVHTNALSSLIKKLRLQDLKMTPVTAGEGFIPFVSPLDTCCQRSCWKQALFLHSWNNSQFP